MKALEFWDGFEDIRNLHYVRKPFIVKNYGEHLEHKNEISTLFDRAMDTGRQVIVLLPVNKEREKAGKNMSADKRPEHHKRDLLLSDRISQGTVKDIIKDIFEINFDDDEKEEIYKDWERKPI